MKLRVIDITEDRSKEIFSSPECQQLFSIYDEYYPKVGFVLPWVSYFIFMENNIVGSCGFTGAPKNGSVEIAYWTFKQFEGKGVASFACRELIAIANQTDPAILIIAKTAPSYNASTKILQNNGFEFSEVVQDEEIGDAWLWVFRP